MNIDEVKIAIGLVVKGGDGLAKQWVKSAEQCGDVFIVVDNGADEDFKKEVMNHPKTAMYLIQNPEQRNMSRDYQKILDMAREQKCNWVWLMDHDEFIPNVNFLKIKAELINAETNSVCFPFFEMRNDLNHYTKIKDSDGSMKDARLVHKMYRILSHYAYNLDNKHSGVLPENADSSKFFLPVPVFHCGHMTQKLRDDKVKIYKKHNKEYGYNICGELDSEWMKDDDNCIIQPFDEFLKIHNDFRLFEK